MVGRIVTPSLTEDDAQSYILAVKEAFHDEPTKFDNFLELLNGSMDPRVDKGSIVTKVEELMKDHQDLLLGFNVFLSADLKKAKQRPESAGTEENHADAEEFMNKLKTRFQNLDTHVVGSFRGIMKLFTEGKISLNEVHQEVIGKLYYHEDLIEDFTTFFKKNDPVAAASLLLHL